MPPQMAMILLLLACSPPPPTLILWAWEAPQDLQALPEGIEVAYLANTLRINQGEIEQYRRKQPLRLPETTPLTAVVRIEGEGRLPVQEAVEKILPVLQAPQVQRLQIDYDARLSQREDYRSLILALHAKIMVPLSITALASWCLGDPWLQQMPVEVVPMAFEVGPDAERVQAQLKSALRPECQSAWGTSLKEFSLPPSPQRVYVFKGGPWQFSEIQALQERVLKGK